MPSPDRPNPDFPGSVLSATLVRVRERRAMRRRRLTAAAATILVLVFAGSAAWWHSRVRSEHSRPVASAPPSSPPKVVAERVPAGPLRMIQRSLRTSSIERIPERDGVQSNWVVRITDEDFFASLPAGQPVALIQNQDGTARLYLLP